MNGDNEQSAFDKEAYLNQEFNQENAIKYLNPPSGEYEAMCDGVDIQEMERRDNADNQQPYMTILNVTHRLIGERAEEAKQKNDWPEGKPFIARQSIFLDLEGSDGRLSTGGVLAFGPGRNVPLGRLREAVGLNRPGEPFSFKRMIGAGPYRVKIEPDRKDPENFVRVTRTAPMSGTTGR